MENKIKAKKVGEVNIFEIMGELTGDFALRGREAMQQSLLTHSNKRRNVLFNIRSLQEIDETGAEALLMNADGASKSALLSGLSPMVEYIRQRDKMKKLSFLKNEAEAAHFFCHEFAAPTLEEQIYPERRQFIRLKTVLPIHFWYEAEDQKKVEFFAVATNLSEGGLFAQFIESLSEDSVKRNLNPYDLRLLYIKIGLEGTEPLSLSGKVIHGNLTEGGIGIEFYESDDTNKTHLRDWIAKHLLEGGGRQ